jgi:hypothetical protein
LFLVVLLSQLSMLPSCVFQGLVGTPYCVRWLECDCVTLQPATE